MYFLVMDLYNVKAKYIINLHHNTILNPDRRKFEEEKLVCHQPIISSDEAQTAWNCDQEMIGELGYPRQTKCQSQCIDGYSRLHGTSGTIECVDRRPQYGQEAREWNPKPLFCKSDTCETSEIKTHHVDGEKWLPKECVLQQRVRVGTECRYLCNRPHGFHKLNTISVKCTTHGKWIFNNDDHNNCISSHHLANIDHIPVDKLDHWPITALPVDEEISDYYNHDVDELKIQLKKNKMTETTNRLQTETARFPEQTGTFHNTVHRIYTGLASMYTGSAQITVIVVTVLILVIIVLILVIACIGCKKRKVTKYVAVDERGHQLLPVDRNYNNNSKSSTSEGNSLPHHHDQCPLVHQSCQERNLRRTKYKRHAYPVDYNSSSTSYTESEEPLLKSPKLKRERARQVRGIKLLFK